MPRKPSKPTVVLSVDWDYFFPDTAVYDWGHAETNPLFFDMVWQTRPGAHDVLKPNNPVAIDAMWPSGHQPFWNGIVARGAKKLLLAESHSSILDFVGERKNLIIHNVDAHHDLGYGKGDDGTRMPDCGNWGATLIQRGQVAEYHQHWPTWRKDAPETKPAFSQATFDFDPPTGLKPDLVFVCRSSCWCPPWADHDWMGFIGGAMLHCRRAKALAVQYVMEPRKLDEKAAREIASQMRSLQDLLVTKQAAQMSATNA